ncbi:hypothetical protein HI806_19180 (plasmid) [Ralstonia solanacearum]|uniref:hypothetical protein n=1 Tax=Ralstonia pseudosolanacearum TaxID=1310165 RepID=UPI0002C041C7|nr:hypothetical protein [Ralstonia pseudosolanacearum]ANH35113.1 hypothetical protein A3768_4294 [Ralstonia solanacearum]APF90029.1 hypothetical protein BCR16_25080 [Ralstonia solanacearum FJAT-1458]AGH86035.1 hypothetical protein F504_3522 [Ralstonia pseudosolanacearum FQY_4]MCD9228757.1 hypothetical protein [Ralstonia pseudosolanacearum]MCK4129157.1 hypothetical protein [Ralstonia pseudosolanacearum]
MSAPQNARDALQFHVEALDENSVKCSVSHIKEVSIDPSESIVHTEQAHYLGATITTLRLSGGGSVSMIVTDTGRIRDFSFTYGVADFGADGRVVVRSWRESDNLLS